MKSDEDRAGKLLFKYNEDETLLYHYSFKAGRAKE